MPERTDLVRPGAYPLAGIPYPGGFPPQPEEVDVRAYLAVVRRRWKAILVVFLAVFGSLAGMTLSKRKVYEATTKVIISEATRSVADDTALAGLTGGNRTVGTEIEVLNSSDLIESAFARMPEEQRRSGFGEQGPPGWSFEITNKKDTNVIYVKGRAWNPESAAAFANHIAETYLDRDLNESSRAARQAREFVSREMDQAQRELSKASLALAVFQRHTGLMSGHEQAGQVASASISLEDQVADAQSAVSTSDLQLRYLQARMRETAPTIRFEATETENPQFALVQNKLMELENRLYELSQEYAPGSRQIRQVTGQIEAQKRRLANMSRTLVTRQTEQHNPLADRLLESYSAAKSDQIAAQQRLAALQSQLQERTTDLKGIPMQVRQLSQLQQRVDVLNRTFNMLSDKYYNLRIEERSRLAGAVIAARAKVPGGPASPRVPVELLRAFVLACGLAAAAALLLERMDTKVHRPDEVERATGVPTLAMLPVSTSADDDLRLRLGHTDPSHAFVEAFRLLRNNLLFSMPDEPLRAIAVTSSVAGEGKSTTSVNLAKAFAMDGKRVLLIDLDLRRPSVHSWHRSPNLIGFTNLVRGDATLEEAVRGSEDGYDVLTTGPLPPDPTEFMNAERSRGAMAELKSRYDIVVVDSPPCYGLSDMQVIGLMVDGVVLVTALDRVQKPLLSASERMLRQAGVRLLGTIVNHAGRGSGYYGYYGRYGDAYAHDVSEGKRRRRELPSGTAGSP
ncbi:MAG TPA: polysaccharide biosynthesis tyrosine autokinase [Fimbriimonas sp.]